METVSPEKYIELYNSYKNKLANASVKKWSKYQVFLSPEIANKLNTFIPGNR